MNCELVWLSESSLKCHTDILILRLLSRAIEAYVIGIENSVKYINTCVKGTDSAVQEVKGDVKNIAATVQEIKSDTGGTNVAIQALQSIQEGKMAEPSRST